MSSTIDQQFVEFIVKSLVGDPDSVQIVRTIDEKGVLLELTVAQEDLGRVIGKRGATAQSIRTLLRALGTKNEARYNLKIVDPEGDQRPRPAPADDEVSATVSAPADDTSDNTTDDEPVAEESVVEEVAEVTEEADDDSMVARHRRDLEDFDDDDL
jgi:predicted RNA-binding protein YlqC (UPF0109 family)